MEIIIRLSSVVEVEEVECAFSMCAPSIPCKSIHTYKRDGFIASFEWAIPATITILVIKPFLEGFFKDMGKEAFSTLRPLIQDLFKIGKDKDERVYRGYEILSAPTNADLSVIGTQIPPLHLEFKFGDAELRIKFIYPSSVPEEDIIIANNAIEKIDLSKFENPVWPGPLIFIYDSDSGIWLDQREWIQKLKPQG